MNKLIVLLVLLAGFPLSMLSQTESKVGVNTREPSENLHVDGTLRVGKLPLNGTANSIFTNASGKNSTNRDQTFTAKNMVVANEYGVLGAVRGVFNWFFMPSITIPTNVTGTTQTLDLYAEFKKQFETPKVVSAGAPAAIMSTTPSVPSVPSLPANTDLYYYITDYDALVLGNVSISAQGVMTYTVKGAPTEASYVNIVFVLK